MVLGQTAIVKQVFRIGLVCVAALLLARLEVPAQEPAPNAGKPSAPAANTPPLSAAQRKVADGLSREALGRPGEAFKGWENPVGVLVLTGEQQGYLEPCGCTENQAGGLARRMDLFQQMWAKGWNTLAMDVGGNLNKDRLTRDQAKLKLEFFRKASQLMKYQAWGLGVEELKLGAENLFIMHSDWSNDETFVPFVSANVTLLSSRDIGTPKEYRVVQMGNIKVGITSVIGKTDPHPINGVNRMLDFNMIDPLLIKIDQPEAVLPGVVQRMRAEGAQFMVLLAHAGEAESKALAARFPDFNVIVTAAGPEDPIRTEQRAGRALFIEPGQKGKHAACVGIFQQGNQLVTKFELVELDRDRFKNAPEMTQLMREYQQAIEQTNPDGQYEIPFDRNHPDLAFVGGDKCMTCHTKAHEVWKESRHAHAFQSLADGRADEPKEYVVNRQFDPECLACHATGWHPQRAERYKTGFISLAKTPHLAGQQCENCHGPGSEHVTLETAFAQNKQLTEALTASREMMQNTRDCQDCHDHDNSPHFDFDKYWEGKEGRKPVLHSGKD